MKELNKDMVRRGDERREEPSGKARKGAFARFKESVVVLAITGASTLGLATCGDVGVDNVVPIPNRPAEGRDAGAQGDADVREDGGHSDADMSDGAPVDAGPSGDADMADAGPGDADLADGGSADSDVVDGGSSDGGPVDGGSGDSGVVDAGDVDSGSVDGGAGDSGVVDAGDVDSGSADGGPVDGGAGDSGVVDAGDVDSGSADGGPVDGGAGDSGVVDAGDGGVLPLCGSLGTGSWSGVTSYGTVYSHAGYEFVYEGVNGDGDPVFDIYCASSGVKVAEDAVFVEYGTGSIEFPTHGAYGKRITISTGGASGTSANVAILVEDMGGPSTDGGVDGGDAGMSDADVGVTCAVTSPVCGDTGSTTTHWSGLINTTTPAPVGDYVLEYVGVDSAGEPVFDIKCGLSGGVIASDVVFVEYGVAYYDVTANCESIEVMCGGANSNSANIAINILPL
jgi:hypothetical protein